MITIQAAIDIDADDDALFYHGVTLDSETLERLIRDLVYEHTNAYAEQITVKVNVTQHT